MINFSFRLHAGNAAKAGRIRKGRNSLDKKHLPTPLQVDAPLTMNHTLSPNSQPRDQPLDQPGKKNLNETNKTKSNKTESNKSESDKTVDKSAGLSYVIEEQDEEMAAGQEEHEVAQLFSPINFDHSGDSDILNKSYGELVGREAGKMEPGVQFFDLV